MYVMPKPIDPSKIVGGSIAVYDNSWLNVKETIKKIELEISNPDSSIKFNKAQTLGEELGGKETTIRRTNSIIAVSESVHVSETMREIHNEFYLKINSALGSYTPLMGIQDNIYFAEGFNLLRYQGGEHYDAHYDGGTSTKRSVSPILYLNDDYEGGEIEFVNFGIKIKPKAGQLFLFPSSYPYRHIAHPVTKGTKYALVTWLHDTL
jgi:predicted 2-oxoglutarate/Fe(II)-dependent dioxygenase YbiX